VPDARRNAGGVAAGEHPLAAVDHERDLAPNHVEALGDRGVEVLGGHAATRGDEQVRDQHAVGVLVRVRQDHDPLPGGRILEDLASPVHAADSTKRRSFPWGRPG
jgi:hypothetical protein